MLSRAFRYVADHLSRVVRALVDAFEKLIQLPRNIKQALLLLIDMVFVCFAMRAAVALRVGHSNFQIAPVEYVCAAITVAG